MFFLAIPALLETFLTIVVGTVAAKAASDIYDHIKGSDADRNH